VIVGIKIEEVHGKNLPPMCGKMHKPMAHQYLKLPLNKFKPTFDLSFQNEMVKTKSTCGSAALPTSPHPH
jgi:hypothetical protein